VTTVPLLDFEGLSAWLNGRGPRRQCRPTPAASHRGTRSRPKPGPDSRRRVRARSPGWYSTDSGPVIRIHATALASPGGVPHSWQRDVAIVFQKVCIWFGLYQWGTVLVKGYLVKGQWW
jgi:hypothetical protein